ncbi:LysR family transcriptional regulator [Pseudotenacibaculum haliotis]|uniref:LysR substrate-binding domain-containing protein n=1 Tax=Pseudotenacibaculum haliotis TaxID=1862138 RepID=A0ABW5LTT5_9FLAO
MDIRQLEYFLVVAEELNFRKASERLYISQPPLTRCVKRLEEELGVELFVREKKRIKLSKSGALFYQKCKNILINMEKAKESIRQVEEGYTGLLRIGFTIFGMSKLAVDCIREFAQKYPKVKLVLDEIPGTYNAKESLIEGENDIIFTYGLKNDIRLVSKIIERDEIVYAIPNNNPISSSESLSIKEMKDEDFIIFPRHVDSLWYDVFLEKCFDEGFTPRIVQHIESMWRRINLVSMGLGIAFTGNNFVDIGVENVSYVPSCEKEKIELPITLSYKKEDENMLIKKFLDVMKRFDTHS